MTKAKIYLFNNIHTGDVLALTKAQGRELSEDWARIKPVINDKGQRVLRMQLNGATVDLAEKDVPKNGNAKPE